MDCPKCGSPRAKRNGMGRGWCLDGRHSFPITPELNEAAILETTLARQGHAPDYDMTRPAAPGFDVWGVSTQYREDGSIASQWVKTRQNAGQQAAVMEAAVSAFAEQLPREAPRLSPLASAMYSTQLLNLYILTDFHLGMLAWGEETGEDWDLSIAEELLVAWFSAAIAQAPPAAVAVFAQLGDFLHWDGFDAVTPAHRHLLDADTRFPKLVRVAIRAIRRIIGLLLEKYPQVVIIMAEGNHDPAASVWLREWLAAVYENEPRVTVDRNPDPYYCIEHGQTSLFFHHGHKRKPSNIAEVFAGKFRDVFGRTTHSYAHMGHMHHTEQKENNLMLVEQHRTLAAPDAYASRGGWGAGRDAQVITYHSEFGEVGRIRLSPKMLACSQPAAPV